MFTKHGTGADAGPLLLVLVLGHGVYPEKDGGAGGIVGLGKGEPECLGAHAGRGELDWIEPRAKNDSAKTRTRESSGHIVMLFLRPSALQAHFHRPPTSSSPFPFPSPSQSLPRIYFK